MPPDGGKAQPIETWVLVSAGVLGGLGAAVSAALAPAGLLVGLPVGLAVAGTVAGSVYGIRALAGRASMPLRHRRAAAPSRMLRGSAPPRIRPAGDLPAPARGGDAERWLRRAETAVHTLHLQTVVQPQLGGFGDQAGEVLGDLARFAGQVTLLEQTSAGINVGRLQQDRAQLQHGLHGLPLGPLRAERERALRAVTDQLDVARRLHDAREMLLARMQAAVLGLEGLVARMAELLALHATSDGGTSLTAVKVAELTSDLEGMRDGLAEAERLSRSALAGGQVQ